MLTPEQAKERLKALGELGCSREDISRALTTKPSKEVFFEGRATLSPDLAKEVQRIVDERIELHERKATLTSGVSFLILVVIALAIEVLK